MIAVAQALNQKSTEEHSKCVDLISLTWTQSLFRRMGFVRRMRTTGKPEIPNRAVMETKLLFGTKFLVWWRNITFHHYSL